MDDKLEKNLMRELKRHAKAVGIPDGSAEAFVEATVKAVKKKIPKATTITELDLKRIVTKELRKYNADLAYVYRNYDTII